MHFANEHLAYLFLACPALIYLLWWRKKRYLKRLCAFADISLHPQIAPAARDYQRLTNRTMFSTALISFFLVLSILRPQWGFTWKEREQRGVDIVVAVDVSESMLAKDIQPNRLSRARWEIEDLVKDLQGDRIGLVTFAGVAFIESPLTVDYGTFKVFLKSLTPDLIPVQGTNIEQALEKSIEALIGKDKSRTLPNGGAIILITDGESFDGELTQIAMQAKNLGIRIYILGVGTPEGAPIPTSSGYKKDKEGRVVITRLSIDALQGLAEQTGGIYVNSITSNEDIKAIYDQGIKRALVENTLKNVRTRMWHEYFQLPLLISLIILLFPPAVMRIRQLIWRNVRRTRPLVIMWFSYLLLAPLNTYGEYRENLGARGVEAFEKSDFNKALSVFEAGSREHPNDFRFSLGQGASHYRRKEFNEAKAAFVLAASKAVEAKTKAAALYNAGNSQVQLGEVEDAIKSYEDSLKLVPDDQEVKDNLEYAKRLLREKNKQQEQQKQDNNQDSNQQNRSTEQSSLSSSGGDSSTSSPSSAASSETEQNGGNQSSSQDSSNQDTNSTSEGQSTSESSNSTSSDHNSGAAEDSSSSSDAAAQQGSDQSSSGDHKADASISSTPDDATGNQLEALLGNVDEKREALLRFRRSLAQQELKREQRQKPERDW